MRHVRFDSDTLSRTNEEPGAETNVGAQDRWNDMSDAHNSIAFGKLQDTRLEEVGTSERRRESRFKSGTFTDSFTPVPRIDPQNNLLNEATSEPDNSMILPTDLFAPYNDGLANNAAFVKKIGSGGTGTVCLVFTIPSL